MRQAAHILAKDIRHLWPYVVIVWLLFFLHAYFDVVSWPLVNNEHSRTANTMFMLLLFLLPLGVWLLIASLVLDERLPGDRQWWLTRPYRRPQLLIAKTLFILLFVNVPFFISDCGILGSQGFVVASVLPRILLRQLPLTILFVLPPLAIAAVTSGMAQFFLGWLLVLIAFIIETLLASVFIQSNAVSLSGASGPLVLLYLALVCLAAVFWQYASRRTLAARVWLAAAILFAIPVLDGASRLAAKIIPGKEPAATASAVQVGYDLDRKTLASAPNGIPQGTTEIRLPLEISGLKPHTLLRGSGTVSVAIDGKPWPRKNWKPGTFIEQTRDGYVQTWRIEEKNAAAVLTRPAQIQTELRLEIVTDTPLLREPLDRSEFRVPGLGLCRTFRTPDDVQFSCRSGLESGVETEVRVESGSRERPVADFFAAALPYGLSPTSDRPAGPINMHASGADLVFIPRHSLTHFTRTLELSGVDLAKYVVHGALSQ